MNCDTFSCFPPPPFSLCVLTLWKMWNRVWPIFSVPMDPSSPPPLLPPLISSQSSMKSWAGFTTTAAFCILFTSTSPTWPSSQLNVSPDPRSKVALQPKKQAINRDPSVSVKNCRASKCQLPCPFCSVSCIFGQAQLTPNPASRDLTKKTHTALNGGGKERKHGLQSSKI